MHPLSLLLRMLKLFFDLLEAVFADTLAVEINNVVGIVAKNARGVVFHENYFSPLFTKSSFLTLYLKKKK